MSTIATAARWSCILLTCSWLAGCSPTPRGIDRTQADTRFEKNNSLVAAIRDADRVTLYEGLPHQLFERTQLEKERQAKPTVQLHGFPFYREPLEVTPLDQESLKKLLGDATSFREWQGHRTCGGFHPDYLAECRVGDKEYRFLLCFGCGEVKVYGPDDSLHCDFAGDTEKQLEEMLKKYRKNRPEFRLGE